MTIYQYQTIDLPLELNVEGVLQGWKKVYVSIQQGEVFIEQDDSTLGIDEEHDTINMHLSQEETGMFRVGPALLQVNIFKEGDVRPVSDEVEIEFAKNQHPRVIL